MSSKLFTDKETHYIRGATVPSPFLNKPSGSHWKKPQLEWLNILFKRDCDVEYMFTESSALRQSGILYLHLKAKLDLSWNEVTTQAHEAGSVYQTLATLASDLPPLPTYQQDETHSSSSPRSSHSSDAPILKYNSHGAQGVFTAPARSAASPLKSQSSRQVKLPFDPSNRQNETPPQLPLPESSNRQSMGQAALTRKDYPYEPSIGTSSASSEDLVEEEQGAPSPKLPVKGNEGWNPDNQLERDVETAVSAFLFQIQNAFLATEANLTEVDKREQDLNMNVR